MNKEFKRSISHSALNTIDPDMNGSPKKFLDYMDRKYYIDTPATRLGKLIHMAILEPEKYSKEVVVCNKPSDSIVAIIDGLYAEVRNKLINELAANLIIIDDYTEINPSLYIRDYEDELFDIARRNGYRNNYGKIALVNHIIDEGNEYYSTLIANKDSILITQEEDSKVKNAIFAVQNNSAINRILNNQDKIIESEKIILWNYRGFSCKGIIDRQLTEKCIGGTMFSIIDVKTTEKPLIKYKWDFISYKTYRQIAFYEMGIVELNGFYPDNHYVIVVHVGEYPESKLFKVDREYILKGMEDIDKQLDRLEFHIENGWNNSMETMNEEIEILTPNYGNK